MRRNRQEEGNFGQAMPNIPSKRKSEVALSEQTSVNDRSAQSMPNLPSKRRRGDAQSTAVDDRAAQ